MKHQKVYLDTANAPSQLFISTIRGVMNELEARTGMNLFEETNIPNGEGNIDFNYSTNLSATTFVFRNAPPGSGLSRGAPYNAIDYLDRTATTAQRIREAVTHELNGHTLVGEVDENFPIASYPILDKDINKLKVSRALSDYTNLSKIYN